MGICCMCGGAVMADESEYCSDACYERDLQETRDEI